MLWIILSVLTAFSKASIEAAGKAFTTNKKNKINEYTLAYGWRLLTWVIVLFGFFFISIPEINLNIFIALIISSLINAITTIWLLKSVKYWDISLVWPLWSVTIPLLYITSYYINGETPNLYWFMWVLLIFLGTYFLWVWSSQWLLEPIKAIFRDKWARYMLLTAFLWSISAPFDKIWVQEIWVIPWILLTSITIVIFMTPITLYYRPQSFNELKDIRALKTISLYSIIWAAILWLQFFALKYTLVIYVISIKRASWIFSVIFWALFFKEKNIMQKLIAVSIMLIGVGIITIWGNI